MSENRKRKSIGRELEKLPEARIDGVAAWPKFMGEASTLSWMLKAPRTARRKRIASFYYEKPVRSYLVRLGCPKDDLDELTNDILLKLHTYILIHYNPSRRFRPYFKTAIKNAYFNYVKRKAKPDAELHENIEVLEQDEDEDEDDIFLEGLKDYARHIYEFYIKDIPERLKMGAQMLHNWIIDGLSQSELSRQWKLSDRSIRTCINQTADHFSDWLHQRINPQDISKLTTMAARYGCTIDQGVWNIRTLFRHASRQKRMNTLLILSFIYKKMEKERAEQ